MWNETDHAQSVRLYRDEYRKFGRDPRSLFWPREHQNAGFAALTDVTQHLSGRILDIGCGFGDLYAFLRQQGYDDIHYTGVDIVPEFIEECRRAHPGADFRECDILREKLHEKWDWCMLAGTLNHRLQSGDQVEDFIKPMLRRMFELSDKGFAADFLSTRTDDRHPDFYHADPREILEIIQDMTPRAALRHDYLPYQFTVYAYKNTKTDDRDIYVAAATGRE